jgi:hypothetical protein
MTSSIGFINSQFVIEVHREGDIVTNYNQEDNGSWEEYCT